MICWHHFTLVAVLQTSSLPISNGTMPLSRTPQHHRLKHDPSPDEHTSLQPPKHIHFSGVTKAPESGSLNIAGISLMVETESRYLPPASRPQGSRCHLLKDLRVLSFAGMILVRVSESSPSSTRW